MVRRLLWLAVRLVQKRHVNFLAYHGHFGLTIRTYWRDLQTLKRFGIATRSHRDHGRVVLTGVDL